MSRFIGRIRDFNESSDDWALYHEMLDHYFIANGIIDEQRKKSTLLSAIDINTYKLLTTLTFPLKPGTVPFSQLCDLLTKHLRPPTIVFRERSKFYAYRKDAKETVTEYYARLQRLAARCDFDATTLESKFLDKFVCGFGDGDYFDRLCAHENNLNVALALALALEVEQTMQKENARMTSALSLCSLSNSSLSGSKLHLWRTTIDKRQSAPEFKKNCLESSRSSSKVCNQCTNERKLNGQYNHSYCVIKDKVDLLKLNYVSKMCVLT